MGLIGFEEQRAVMRQLGGGLLGWEEVGRSQRLVADGWDVTGRAEELSLTAESTVPAALPDVAQMSRH